MLYAFIVFKGSETLLSSFGKLMEKEISFDTGILRTPTLKEPESSTSFSTHRAREKAIDSIKKIEVKHVHVNTPETTAFPKDESYDSSMTAMNKEHMQMCCMVLRESNVIEETRKEANDQILEIFHSIKRQRLDMENKNVKR
jgi:hypothetical protein